MRLSDLAGRRVGVWGFGREGKAALRALTTLVPSSDVVVVTDTAIQDAADIQELEAAGVPMLAGPDGIDALKTCDALVRSPGVSRYRPELDALREHGVTLTTGTNLWFAERRRSNVIGVTGSKGKSTTASVIAHLLERQGHRVVLAGNIGRPLLDCIGSDAEPDMWVLELSSYQLSDLATSPTVAVVLNLFREHIDWHGTEERYFADKLNILRDCATVTAVLNGQDTRLRVVGQTCHDVRWFGTESGFHTRGEDIYIGNRMVYSGADIPLRGQHNRTNVCAALTAVEAAGGDSGNCRDALRSFQALPHRLQDVATIDGRTYVDDSIATTPEAARAALDAIGAVPITVLLGGFDREYDYRELGADIARRDNVVAVLTLPDNGARIFDVVTAALHEANHARRVHVESTTSLDAAVRRAAHLTPAGGVILLSPAAPSFGHFRNFEVRGDAFKAAALRQGVESVREA